MNVALPAARLQHLTRKNMELLKEQFEEKDDGDGLSLSDFAYVMIKCLGTYVTNKVDFVTHVVELFRQVDINDDGGMEWEELTSYIVEAGMSTSGADGAGSSRVQFLYERYDNPQPNNELVGDVKFLQNCECVHSAVGWLWLLWWLLTVCLSVSLSRCFSAVVAVCGASATTCWRLRKTPKCCGCMLRKSRCVRVFVCKGAAVTGRHVLMYRVVEVFRRAPCRCNPSGTSATTPPSRRTPLWRLCTCRTAVLSSRRPLKGRKCFTCRFGTWKLATCCTVKCE